MKKIAIFVEGLTESIFVHKLIEYFYGYKGGLKIKPRKIRGKYRIINAYENSGSTPAYYVLIYDSGQDRRVVSDIKQNAENMIKNEQFDMIIGLRDLYPNKRQELGKMEKAMAKVLANIYSPGRVKVHVAVMETEAWFLADFGMLFKTDTTLNVNNIKQVTNLQIDQIDPEKTIDHPANVIDAIFKTIGKRYRKHEDEIHGIVSKLDFDFLCLDAVAKGKISKFNDLLQSLEKV